MTLGPTLQLNEAAAQTWDALVVGAGPAGATAARELARLGAAVLLVDRAAFPRGKVCGCCLNGNALATLTAVGLGDLVSRGGAVSLRALQLGARGATARLTLPQGAALSREVFDAALVAAAVAAGAQFLPATRAVLDGGDAAARWLRLEQAGGAVRTAARVVVAADGLGGQLLARAGETAAPAAPGARIGAGATIDDGPEFYRPGVIYIACGAGGYVGLVRLEDGRLVLAAAFDAADVRAAGGPGAAAARRLDEAGWPAPNRLAERGWRGTAALTRRATRLAGERVFVIGDAAGYVEPFTGEGMAWALAAGVAVAPLAVRAVARWRPALAATWEVRHRQIVGRRQGICRAAAAVLRRPWLARGLIRLLAVAPALAAPVVAALDRPSRIASGR
jgi:flavin-dependent dehydrogenase